MQHQPLVDELTAAELAEAVEAARRVRARAMDTLGTMKDVGTEGLVQFAMAQVGDAHRVYRALRGLQDSYVESKRG